MRNIILIVLLLGGCATTTEGIGREAVNETYASSKPPLDVARCLQEAMSDLDIELFENGAVSVSRRNQFGSVLLNWFIRPSPSGSAIELRKANSLAPGQDRATRCF